jgi:hypothetical protein
VHDERARRRESRTGLILAGVAALAALAYAWWAAGLAPFSAGATVAVLSAGVVAIAAGSRSRRPAPRRVTVRQAAPWIALALAAAAVQLVSYVQTPREDHPTISSLTNALLDSHPARAAALAFWLALAVGLARR